MAKKDSTPKPKFKKCKVCKTSFQLFRTTQKVCSPGCAIELARVDNAKKEKKAHTEKKRKLKDEDRSFQLKKTQGIFNKYIRLRDGDLPCISCGRHHSGQYHAGHYKTVGGNPELRFHPDNCHKQCSACNNHLSGNIVNFRIGLANKIGVSRLDYIEGPHEPKRYTIQDLKDIQETYKRKIKELEQ